MRADLRAHENSTELRDSVDALFDADIIQNSVGEQVRMVFELGSASSERRDLRRKLAELNGVEVASLGALELHAGPRSSEALDRLISDESKRVRDEQVSAVLLRPPMLSQQSRFDLATVAKNSFSFSKMLKQIDLSSDLFEAAIADSRMRATDAQHAAERELLRAVIAAALIALASLVTAIMASRSVTRPLRRLAKRATESVPGSSR